MTEKYVQVNIGQGELSQDSWERFQGEALVALRNAVRGEPTLSIETHDSVGYWDESAEDSTHISIVADVDTYALRAKLAELKSKYNQDAIGLIVGSDLI